MYRKIAVYINGKLAFTTKSYAGCRQLYNRIRATKHIEVDGKHFDVYANDKLKCVYSK